MHFMSAEAQLHMQSSQLRLLPPFSAHCKRGKPSRTETGQATRGGYFAKLALSKQYETDYP